MCDYAERVCKMVNNRGFQIKNAIDWKRFLEGSVLIISKKNEVHLRVKTEPNYARELSDFFTFEVPGLDLCPPIEIGFGMEKLDCILLHQMKYTLDFTVH